MSQTTFSLYIVLSTLLTLFARVEGQKGWFQSDNQDSSRLGFCYQDNYFEFSTKACPGGVKFFKPLVIENADKACVCSNGYFIPGLDDRLSHSLLVGGGVGKGKCRRFNKMGWKDANNIRGKVLIDAYVPLTSEFASEETISFAAAGRLTSFRRFNPVGLRTYGRTVSTSCEAKLGPKPKFCSLDTFFANPSAKREYLVGDNGVVFLGQFNRSTTTRLLAATRKPLDKGKVAVRLHLVSHKKFLSTSLRTSKTMKPESLAISEPGECKLPPLCVGTEASYVRNKLKSDPSKMWKYLTPEMVKERLTKEFMELTEYRMRMEMQNARLRISSYSPRLKILDLVQKIFAKVAQNALDSKFIAMNFKFMEYLYFDEDNFMNLDSKHYAGIEYALGKCFNYIRPLFSNVSAAECPVPGKPLPTVPLQSDIGGRKVIHEEESSITEGPTPSEDGLHPSKYDLIVELAWMGVDLVHSICYPYFSFQPNLHDYFTTEMEKFFMIEALQYRWFRDISVKQWTVYRVLLPGLTQALLTKAAGVVNQNFVERGDTIHKRRLMKPIFDKTHSLVLPSDKAMPISMGDRGRRPCPPNRVIWGGLACCLDYNLDRGIHIPDPSPTNTLTNGNATKIDLSNSIKISI